MQEALWQEWPYHSGGHGVVEFEANMHNGEAGMMNEMMADVLGAAVEASITGVTLRDYFLNNDGYVAGREKMARVAQEQYGEGSIEHLSVCDAWTAVGVPNTGTYCP